MFSKTSDILKLTGLPDRNALWDAGFCSDQRLREVETYEDEGDEYTEIHWIDDADWLGQQMENYCVGYNYCEFNGKHYYTVHHS